MEKAIENLKDGFIEKIAEYFWQKQITKEEAKIMLQELLNEVDTIHDQVNDSEFQ